MYDNNNTFAKILRQEIPCSLVYDDEHNFAFHDINPQAPIHIIIIPKGSYKDYHDFAQYASEAEIASFSKAIMHIANKEPTIAANGYRLITNIGSNANQEVPHYHMHLLAGENLGGIR